MLKRILDIFSSVKLTVAAGIFLAASLIMMLADIEIPIDPAWVTTLICGYPLFYYAISGLFTQKGMDRISSALLISIAIVASIMIDELFAAGEIAFIMAIGGVLEEKTVERAKKGLKQLISLVPEQGRKINGDDDNIIMLPIEQVKVNDILRVLPGEAFPVDGEIIFGNTSVNQSIVTGESLPVDKVCGDEVYCGTINCFGAVDIKTTKVGEDSSLQKLIRLVEEAENKKAPMQRIVDKWASWLVPTALLIAVITYFATKDILRAVTVLVVFCPCALALATPTSIMAAIGRAAKNGVIIKSGEALERMGKVDCIAFDKTGTLTEGNLTVSEVVSFDKSLSDNEILTLMASAEIYSEHPLGKAVVLHAKQKNCGLIAIEDFEMLPGKGISVTVPEGNRRIMCGNAAYLEENDVTINNNIAETVKRVRGQGKAVILISDSGICVGMAALSDTLRTSAKGMVAKLNGVNVRSVLLTGDHRQTADYLAKQISITDVYSELLPAQKAEQIQMLQNGGNTVCMIGDGVNDAPALKTADVGVAMGKTGSDIAVEAADIALIGNDLTKIPYLKKLSNDTVRLIKINIFLSMAINFAAIILSVLALLNPVTGALVHNGGSVLVVLNAALLYDRK